MNQPPPLSLSLSSCSHPCQAATLASGEASSCSSLNRRQACAHSSLAARKLSLPASNVVPANRLGAMYLAFMCASVSNIVADGMASGYRVVQGVCVCVCIGGIGACVCVYLWRRVCMLCGLLHNERGVEYIPTYVVPTYCYPNPRCCLATPHLAGSRDRERDLPGTHAATCSPCSSRYSYYLRSATEYCYHHAVAMVPTSSTGQGSLT